MCKVESMFSKSSTQINFADWLKSFTGDSISGVARAIGVNRANLNQQVLHGVIPADRVIAIAHAYGRSPVAALRETGYLDHASDESLADRLDRAMRILTQVRDEIDAANHVTRLPTAASGAPDEPEMGDDGYAPEP